MEVPSGTPSESFGERFLAPLREWLAGWALKANPRLTVDGIAMKLLAAGMGRRLSPTGVLALKGATALAGLFFGTIIGRMGGVALDLLAVSVEAGLGFDAAVAKLSEHMEGPLAEEFGLTLSEMRIGESRQEALKRMAERVDAPELSAFVRAIIQADQLGTTLGRILRVQAADSRLRRQAAAEERAMKAPIKMLFPTVLFIFPAMFVVILGPAIMNI